MNRTDLPKKLQRLLNDIDYVAVATTCTDGSPWNTPVASFNFADDLTLYWASWADNQHSRNIRHSGKAFIVVFDSTPFNGKPTQGIYIQACVTELTNETEVMNAALVFGDDKYNPSDGKEYLGKMPRRIYKAVPQKIWVNNDSTVNGKFVDVRKIVFETV